MFCQLTEFHCLIAFTSWDIGLYVYWAQLLVKPGCDVTNFEINFIFVIKPLTKNINKKVKTKI